MLKYIIKRLLWIIPVLFGVAIVVFTILYFSPGDPAYLALGDNATPEAVEAYRVEMGIDGTYWERLGRLLTGMLHGDLGLSFRSKTPVMDELLVRFKVTFNISAWSIVLGIILGIFFGIVSALKQNSIWDTLSTGCALFGISMPMFWQGLMLILIFSVWLDWLPASGYGTWQHSHPERKEERSRMCFSRSCRIRTPESCPRDRPSRGVPFRLPAAENP